MAKELGVGTRERGASETGHYVREESEMKAPSASSPPEGQVRWDLGMTRSVRDGSLKLTAEDVHYDSPISL